MYETYYGLSAKPFQLRPDPHFFYGSKGHKRALAYLEYGLSQGEGFIVITGEVGAGKTTLVRHLLRALGVRGRIKSPTYAVVEPHSAIDCAVMPAGEPLHIWHFDFYRFNDPREWEDAGFRELFASPGLKLVEWPERAGDFLPVVDLRIDIEPDEMTPHAHIDPDQDTHRRVSAVALTPTGRLLLEALA